MVDEVALVAHLKENPMFRVGLDVFEVNEYTFSVKSLKFIPPHLSEYIYGWLRNKVVV